MRTTITIDDELLNQAKRRALEKGLTLREVIEEALRTALLRSEVVESRPFKLVTFRGTGPYPGFNLDRASELLDVDDAERLGQL